MKKNIFLTVIFLSMLFFGIYLRLSTTRYTPEQFYATFNVGSYYAHISQKLIEDNRLPKTDIWRYSNKSFPENSPPFLPYSTAFFHNTIKHFNIKIYDSIAVFNIVIFILMNIIGGLYVYKKFKSFYPYLVFVFLSSTLPFIVYMQSYARYTEETLGVLLIFLASIFEIERKNKKAYIYLEIVVLALLLLTWQQFHIVLTVVFIANLIFDRRDIGKTIWMLISVVTLSELMARFLFKSNYSPISMVYEALYPIIYQNNGLIKDAMKRTDWASISWNKMLGFFSYFGFFFIFFSLLNFINKKDKKYGENFLFVGIVITGILTIAIIKTRYLLVSYLLLFCAFNYEYLIIENKEELKKIINFIIKVIIILIVGFLVINYKLLINFNYNPVIETKISSENISDKKTKVTLVLKNVGGNQTPDEKGFAGFHIEVFNAKVSNIKSNYSFDKSTVVKKTNAKMKNYYWFETKFNKFDKNNYGEVTFFATKIDVNKPIKVEYRSWIPGYCSLPDRLQSMFSLLADYSGFENSWRNEKCIVRGPKNEDKKFKTCSYKVYAAHADRQEFRCIEEYLK